LHPLAKNPKASREQAGPSSTPAVVKTKQGRWKKRKWWLKAGNLDEGEGKRMKEKSKRGLR
jgi:hypothetical protein